MERNKRIGLFIGRFEPLTIGHCSIINDALSKVDQLIVAIGSSQSESTFKNPFNASLRTLMLSKVYEKEIIEGKLLIALIPDRQHPKDDEEWGKYLLENVFKQTGIMPNVIFEGSETVRNYWFNESVDREIIDKKIIPISATKVREYILNNDYDHFKEFMPKELNSQEFFIILKKIIDKVK